MHRDMLQYAAFSNLINFKMAHDQIWVRD